MDSGRLSAPVIFIQVAAALTDRRASLPEIWSHLDAARHDLERRGLDVAAYDALRTGHGYQAATAACDALRATLPAIDWDSLDRREAESLADMSAAPRERATWKRFVIYAVAFVTGVAGAIAVTG